MYVKDEISRPGPRDRAARLHGPGRTSHLGWGLGPGSGPDPGPKCEFSVSVVLALNQVGLEAE